MKLKKNGDGNFEVLNERLSKTVMEINNVLSARDKAIDVIEKRLSEIKKNGSADGDALNDMLFVMSFLNISNSSDRAVADIKKLYNPLVDKFDSKVLQKIK